MRAMAGPLALLALLAACQWQPPWAAAPEAGLAAPAVQSPGPTTPRPQPRPAAASLPDPEPAEAPPMISAAEAQCLAGKGQWSPMGQTSGHVCLHVTRDSGKSCRAKGDCQGECLATSRTCSPIMPLMGCNAILQSDGTEVNQCLQ